MNSYTDVRNTNIGGNILTYAEGDYYIQWGADTVPKKLGNDMLKIGSFSHRSDKATQTINMAEYYPNYNRLVVDDFYIVYTGMGIQLVQGDKTWHSPKLSKTYDPTTRKLTLNGIGFFYRDHLAVYVEYDLYINS